MCMAQDIIPHLCGYVCLCIVYVRMCVNREKTIQVLIYSIVLQNNNN